MNQLFWLAKVVDGSSFCWVSETVQNLLQVYKRKFFPQLNGPTRKIFGRFLQLFSKNLWTAAVKKNLLILLQESTCHSACSHFPLHMAMLSWFPVENNFSVLEIVSEFSFSTASCMLHIRPISSEALWAVFLVRKLKRFFSPSYLWVRALSWRIV